ncbi:hypothetical protein AYO40_01085 [Planctomycetaceae bacterium SCGC AG-212-D15]|nr:hypothetical protein AYO40_01085 [Planctomycetaceae bacterium SCGC AG-212-D15]
MKHVMTMNGIEVTHHSKGGATHYSGIIESKPGGKSESSAPKSIKQHGLPIPKAPTSKVPKLTKSPSAPNPKGWGHVGTYTPKGPKPKAPSMSQVSGEKKPRQKSWAQQRKEHAKTWKPSAADIKAKKELTSNRMKKTIAKNPLYQEANRAVNKTNNAQRAKEEAGKIKTSSPERHEIMSPAKEAKKPSFLGRLRKAIGFSKKATSKKYSKK